MKTCVYAICKNESKFVKRWLDSMWNQGRGADYICVLDTGSDDNTYELLRQYGNEIGIGDHLILGQKVISPWRFDVARNESMKLIPDKMDALICTDLDETLIPEFWDDFRNCVKEHPNFLRIYYKYAWSHDSNGNNDLVFWYDKITGPEDWRWEFPVHEALNYDGTKREGIYRLDENKVYLHHWPDQSKSRSNYLGLLELRAQENPDDLYGLYYLGREYSFVGRYENAILCMTRLYLKLNKTQNDDMGMMPSICAKVGYWYEKIGLRVDAEQWYHKGLEQCYWTQRELGIRYAQLLAYKGRWKDSEEALEKCLKYSAKTYDWRNIEYMWDDWKVHQIRAVNACWKGEYEDAEKEFVLGLVELDNGTAVGNAVSEGFYSDKAWLEEKIGRKISVDIDDKLKGLSNG